VSKWEDNHEWLVGKNLADGHDLFEGTIPSFDNTNWGKNHQEQLVTWVRFKLVSS
jgi:hypothetical protein